MADETEETVPTKHVIEAFDLPLAWEEVDFHGSIECGFHVSWVSAVTSEGVEVKTQCGAGVGSPWLQVSIYYPEGDGRETRHLRMNGRTLIEAVLERYA